MLMNNLIVKNFVARIRLEATAQIFDVEGMPFEIMGLTKALIEEVKACLTHKDMLFLAANAGLVDEGSRLIDDPVILARIDELWGEGDLDIDSDPCVRLRVGEKVCQISGLESSLDEMLELEEAERVEALKERGHIDGDTETPGVDIDRLNDDATVAVVNM